MQRFESPSLTQIMHAVSAILRAPSGYPPLVEDWIIVPNRDTGRALELAIAGANGGLANTRLVTTDAAITTFFHNDASSLYSTLFWAIATHLETHYHVDPPALGESVHTLATLYQRYLTERPEWLIQWEKGDPSTDPELQWQAILWRTLQTHLQQPQMHHQLNAFFRASTEADVATVGRVIVVCPERLSRTFVQWLQAIDQHREVWILLTNPGHDAWFLPSDSVLDEPIERFRHSLCRSRAETLNTLLDAIDHPAIHPEMHFHGLSALNQLQAAIYHNTPINTVSPDPSICLVDAPTPTREVEALKEWIIDQLNSYPEIRLSDVAIVTPDPGLYGPIVQRVFSDSDPLHHLPTAPDPLIQQSLHDALVHYILDCRRDDFSGQRMLDLLYHPSVLHHLGFSESDRTTIHRWLVDAGAFRGISGHKHSLQAARARLVRGLMMDPQTALLRDGITSEAPEQSARLEWVFALFEGSEIVRNWTEPHTPRQWLVNLTEAISLLSLEQIDTLSFVLPSSTPDLPVSWQLFQTWVQRQITTGLSRPLHFDDRLSVTSPQAAHAVPRRLVAILGANEGTLPESEAMHPWDLLQRLGRRGDPNPVSQQKQWFFDLCMHTETALWLSWIGRNSLTQQPEDPALSIMALRDLLTDLTPHSTAWVHRLSLAHPIPEVTPPSTISSARQTHAGSTQPTILTVSQFLQIVRDPATAFLAHQGSRLQEGESELLEIEPVKLDPLRRYQLRQAAIERGAQGDPTAHLMELSGVPEDALASDIRADIYPDVVHDAVHRRQHAPLLGDAVIHSPSGYTLRVLNQYAADVPRIALGSSRTHYTVLSAALDALVLCARQQVSQAIPVVLYGVKSQYIVPWNPDEASALLDGWLAMAYQAHTCLIPVVMSQALEHAYQLNKNPDVILSIDWTDQRLVYRRGLRRLLEGQSQLMAQHRAFVTQWVCPIETHIKATHAGL